MDIDAKYGGTQKEIVDDIYKFLEEKKKKLMEKEDLYITPGEGKYTPGGPTP